MNEKIASQGSHLATNNLACIYLRERGFIDLFRSYAYFKEATGHNVPQSLYLVGQMYLHGVGVDYQSHAEALSYFKRAKVLGWVDAQEEIEKLEAKSMAPLTITTEFKAIYSPKGP